MDGKTWLGLQNAPREQDPGRAALGKARSAGRGGRHGNICKIFVKINLPVPFCLHPVPLMPVASVVLQQIFNTLLRDSPGSGSPAGAEHRACAVLSYGCKPGF